METYSIVQNGSWPEELQKRKNKVVGSRLSLASMEAMNVQKERGRAIKETASSNGEMKVSHHILYIFYSYHLFAGGILFLETNIVMFPFLHQI